MCCQPITLNLPHFSTLAKPKKIKLQINIPANLASSIHHITNCVLHPFFFLRNFVLHLLPLMSSQTTSDTSSPSMNTIHELDTFTRLFLLLIFIALLIRVCYVYFSTHGDHRVQNPNLNPVSIQHVVDNKNAVEGLPRSIINSYHTFTFNKNNIATINHDYDTICSICISDYKESEILRMMPQCHHYFHRDCVDTWLKVNGSCPVCRNLLLPASKNVPNLESV